MKALLKTALLPSETMVFIISDEVTSAQMVIIGWGIVCLIMSDFLLEMSYLSP